MAYEIVFRDEEWAPIRRRRRTVWETIRHWTTTTNHKDIGILYVTAGLLFFIVGGLMALLMRGELAGPGPTIMDADTYDRMFSMHGTVMIFLFAMPVLAGFANYLVPILIGAEDMAFPRLNALGFWLIPAGAIPAILGAPAWGWTAYAPLSTVLPGRGPDLWLVGLLILGVSSTLGAVNFLTTIYKYRQPKVHAWNMSLFVWTILVVNILLLLSLPVLSAALVMVLADRNLGTVFFDATSGNPLLWQHLFWFFGHPEVYVLILPAMGLISEVIPKFARRPIFGYRSMVLSILAIAGLSFVVWAHHMFAAGIGPGQRIAFMVTTMAIAVPTGVKVFNWTATLFQGRISFEVPLLYAVAFIVLFTIGGISGVMLASVPIDFRVHDTYFVVAHLHYVLFGGTVMGAFAGLYYLYPHMTGRMYNRTLGKVHFWGTAVSMNVVFFLMHFMGLLGMPRRVFDYSTLLATRPELGLLNLAATLGAVALGLFQIPFFYNFLVSRYVGEPVTPGEDPWGVDRAEEHPPALPGMPIPAYAVPAGLFLLPDGQPDRPRR